MSDSVLLIDVQFHDRYNRWVCSDIDHLRDFLKTLTDVDYLKVERIERPDAEVPVA